MEIRNGKKPISAKQPAAALNMDDIFGNPLGIDPAIAEEIKAQGYEYRFISAVQLGQMGGYHPRGWKPYKCDKIKSNLDFKFGSDPEGFIRRGDLVLAVRPKEVCEKHRAVLRDRARERSQVQKTHAESLRQMARSSGVDMKVHEGFEE